MVVSFVDYYIYESYNFMSPSTYSIIILIYLHYFDLRFPIFCATAVNSTNCRTQIKNSFAVPYYLQRLWFMNVVTFSNFYFRDHDQRLAVFVVVAKRLVLLAFRMMIATHQQ